MLRPCLLKAGKFEMDYQNVSNGICQKTSSIKETLECVSRISSRVFTTKLALPEEQFVDEGE